MRHLMNAVLARAGAMGAQQGASLWGIVVAVQGSPFRVKVQIQPPPPPNDDGSQDDPPTTGWLSVVTMAAGNGWGVMTVPQNGMMARLEPDGSSSSHWVVTGFAHSTVDLPPNVPNSAGTGGTLNATNTQPQPGETLLTHSSGTVIRLTKAGVVYIRGLVEIDGDLHVNGNVFDKVGMLDGLRQHYNGHEHPYLPGPGPLADTLTTTAPDP